MRTVWFQVRVHANSVEATERALGTPRGSSQASERVGYALNNYLVANGDPIPDACDQDGVSPTVACTHNPIPAWTVSKASRSASGARLHKGGNVHYQVSATKMNDATPIEGLVFTDDLTHVFKTAGWAPNAAVPGGALKRGIYFFDSRGQSLDAQGAPIGTIEQSLPAFDEHSGAIPAPEQREGRWLLTAGPVDVLPEHY